MLNGATVLASILEAMNLERTVVCVTGTSGVGKSVLVDSVVRQIQSSHDRITVVGCDGFLRPSLRGNGKYQAGSPRRLSPSMFEWRYVRRVIDHLLYGDAMMAPCYVHGHGWEEEQYEPADIVVCEGLFLDSKEAVEAIDPDVLLSISTDDSNVRDWRRERDGALRASAKLERTEAETEQEIERTLAADRAYSRSSEHRAESVELVVDGGHIPSEIVIRAGRGSEARGT